MNQHPQDSNIPGLATPPPPPPTYPARPAKTPGKTRVNIIRRTERRSQRRQTSPHGPKGRNDTTTNMTRTASGVDNLGVVGGADNGRWPARREVSRLSKPSRPPQLGLAAPGGRKGQLARERQQRSIVSISSYGPFMIDLSSKLKALVLRLLQQLRMLFFSFLYSPTVLKKSKGF